MSLPNSPADPYPEAFGWPWHGMIRRPAGNQITDPPYGCEIVLPSGARRPMPSGNQVSGVDFAWSHPFDAGMPFPDIEAGEDQEWWMRGIRRGDGNWHWDRSAVVPCVRDGAPWHITDFYFGNSGVGGKRAAVRVKPIEGVEHYIYSDYLGADPFGVPPELNPNTLQTKLMMHGGSGDRRLLMCYYNRGINVERVGIVEVIVEPELERVSVVVHAVYSDLYRVVSDNPGSSGSPSWTIYYFLAGDPQVLPYGSPPPDGNIGSTSYSVGSFAYSMEEEWTFWAWYKSDGVSVEFVRLAIRLEVSKDFSYGVSGSGYENTTLERSYLIQGVEVLNYVDHNRVDFQNGSTEYQDPSGSFVIQGESLPIGPFERYPVGRAPFLHITTARGTPSRSTDYVDSAVGVVLYGNQVSDLRLQVMFLSNALITMGYSANVMSASRMFQGAAAFPSGFDTGSRLYADTSGLTPDQRGCWASGAWNPVTGEVRRADENYRYNWV